MKLRKLFRNLIFSLVILISLVTLSPSASHADRIGYGLDGRLTRTQAVKLVNDANKYFHAGETLNDIPRRYIKTPIKHRASYTRELVYGTKGDLTRTQAIRLLNKANKTLHTNETLSEVPHHYIEVPVKGRAHSSVNQTILDQLNGYRAHYHLPALRENHYLDSIATVRTKQCSYKFTHYDPKGNSYFGDLIGNKPLGNHETTYYGENIAMNYSANGHNNADYMMMYHDGGSHHWGHRKNILNPRFRYVGIHYTTIHGNNYLSEDFTSNI